eukprot:TRINITY_DN375_c1_g1_i1.p1 TRINITY_DN375_c1_g1~~TRINITY_DN375_c1_g1_i1.p1  ORF type:complete len:360 (+),score=116.01 TRINITY_DN375_c1_g1_i1:68-1147(+)
MTAVELITNVIPASPNSTWEPKHTKARIEKTKIRPSERAKAADYRRAVARREILGKVVAHNMKVKTVAKKTKKPTADQQISNLIAAENRRLARQQKELERLANHHNKVRTLAEKRSSSPPSPMSEKVKNAEIRRENLFSEKKSTIQAHHQKVLELLNQWRTKKPASDEATSALISAADEVMKKEEVAPVKTAEVVTEKAPKKWVPKHTKARIEKPKIRDQDKVKAAEYRRAVNRRAVLAKVVTHNAKVKAVSKKLSKKQPSTALNASQKAASERRERMQQQTIEKLSDHHKKVEKVAAAKKNSTSADDVTEKVEQASQRRESRLNDQKESLSAHHDKVTTTLQKWRDAKKEESTEQETN